METPESKQSSNKERELLGVVATTVLPQILTLFATGRLTALKINGLRLGYVEFERAVQLWDAGKCSFIEDWVSTTAPLSELLCGALIIDVLIAALSRLQEEYINDMRNKGKPPSRRRLDFFGDCMFRLDGKKKPLNRRLLGSAGGKPLVSKEEYMRVKLQLLERWSAAVLRDTIEETAVDVSHSLLSPSLHPSFVFETVVTTTAENSEFPMHVHIGDPPESKVLPQDAPTVYDAALPDPVIPADYASQLADLKQMVSGQIQFLQHTVEDRNRERMQLILEVERLTMQLAATQSERESMAKVAKDEMEAEKLRWKEQWEREYEVKLNEKLEASRSILLENRQQAVTAALREQEARFVEEKRLLVDLWQKRVDDAVAAKHSEMQHAQHVVDSHKQDIAQLTAQLEHLSQRNTQLEDEVFAVRMEAETAISERNSAVNMLTSQSEQLQLLKESFETQLSSMERESAARLQEHVEHAKTQLEQAKAAAFEDGRADGEVKSSAEIARVRARLFDLQKMLKEESEAHALTTLQMEEQRKQLNKAVSDLSVAKTMITDLQHEVAYANSRVERGTVQQQQQSTMISKLSTHAKQVHTLASMQQQLRENVTQLLHTGKAHLQSDVHSIVASIHRETEVQLQQTLQPFSVEANKLRDTVRQQESTLQAISDALADATDISVEGEPSSSLPVIVKQLVDKHTQARATCTTLQHAIDAQTAAAEATEAHIATLTAKLESRDTMLATLHAEIQTLAQRNDELEGYWLTTKEQLKHASEETRKLQEECAALQQQVQDSSHNATQHAGSVSQLQATAARLQSENSVLQLRLQTSIADNTMKDDTVAQLEAEVTRLQPQLESMHANNASQQAAHMHMAKQEMTAMSEAFLTMMSAHAEATHRAIAQQHQRMQHLTRSTVAAFAGLRDKYQQELEASNTTHIQSLQEANACIQQFQQEIEALKAHVDELSRWAASQQQQQQQEAAHKHIDLQRMRTIAAEAQAETAALQEELQHMQKAHEQELRETRVEQQQQVNELQEKLHQVQRLHEQQLQEQHAEQQQQVNELELKLQHMQKAHEQQLQETRVEQQQRVTELQEKLQHMQRVHEKELQEKDAQVMRQQQQLIGDVESQLQALESQWHREKQTLLADSAQKLSSLTTALSSHHETFQRYQEQQMAQQEELRRALFEAQEKAEQLALRFTASEAACSKEKESSAAEIRRWQRQAEDTAKENDAMRRQMQHAYQEAAVSSKAVTEYIKHKCEKLCQTWTDSAENALTLLENSTQDVGTMDSAFERALAACSVLCDALQDGNTTYQDVSGAITRVETAHSIVVGVLRDAHTLMLQSYQAALTEANHHAATNAAAEKGAVTSPHRHAQHHGDASILTPEQSNDPFSPLVRFTKRFASEAASSLGFGGSLTSSFGLSSSEGKASNSQDYVPYSRSKPDNTAVDKSLEGLRSLLRFIRAECVRFSIVLPPELKEDSETNSAHMQLIHACFVGVSALCTHMGKERKEFDDAQLAKDSVISTLQRERLTYEMMLSQLRRGLHKAAATGSMSASPGMSTTITEKSTPVRNLEVGR